ERAEAAAEVADVRVLDVPRDDVADLVAADLAPQAIGGREDALALLAARAEEPHELALAELVARVERQHAARDHERDAAGLVPRPPVAAGPGRPQSTRGARRATAPARRPCASRAWHESSGRSPPAGARAPRAAPAARAAPRSAPRASRRFRSGSRS